MSVIFNAIEGMLRHGKFSKTRALPVTMGHDTESWNVLELNIGAMFHHRCGIKTDRHNFGQILHTQSRIERFQVTEVSNKAERDTIMRNTVVACLMIGLFLCMNPCFSLAQEPEIIKLPPPQKDGGIPLMKALSLRKSTRGDFGPDTPLSMQTLSNLLWAADGVNRPPNHRTAPSAVDWQNIDIYVLTADGVFVYDPIQHSLKVITDEDMRANSGLEGSSAGPMKQDFAKTAPVSLVYVANLAETKTMNYGGESVGLWWSAVGVGAISQNVYLFCASENLACIVRAMVDATKLSQVFKLGPDQKVMLTSTIAQFKE